MKTTLPNRPLSRRDFLRASAGLMGMAALAACAPGAAAACALPSPPYLPRWNTRSFRWINPGKLKSAARTVPLS